MGTLEGQPSAADMVSIPTETFEQTYQRVLVIRPAGREVGALVSGLFIQALDTEIRNLPTDHLCH